jgi:hypothetical protein
MSFWMFKLFAPMKVNHEEVADFVLNAEKSEIKPLEI